MGGIEILALTVILILGAIGVVRGPSKELGVTMALVVVLAIFAQFDALVNFAELPARVNAILANLGLDSDDPVQQRMVVLFLYSSVLIVTAFLAYQGQDTLAFKWQAPPGAVGVLLGGLVGALNGYLIFGTFWYYLHQLNYPIQRYAWFRAEFTEAAQTMINLLPQNLASGMVMAALALALLWWRILK